MATDLEPPDVELPLSEQQRAKLLVTVLRTDDLLQHLRRYVDVDVVAWPSAMISLFSRSPVAGERPPDVLRRWWVLFRDDLDLLHEVRNRIVHQIPLSDAELIRVGWLARRLREVTDPDNLFDQQYPA